MRGLRVVKSTFTGWLFLMQLPEWKRLGVVTRHPTLRSRWCEVVSIDGVAVLDEEQRFPSAIDAARHVLSREGKLSLVEGRDALI